MSEEDLEVSDVGAAFVHGGGDGMAPDMATSSFIDSRVHDVGAQAFVDASAGDARAAISNEEGGGWAPLEEGLADFVDVAGEPSSCTRADGHDAVLAPFAKSNEQKMPIVVDVGEIECNQFIATEARAVEQLEYGAIAQSERRGEIGTSQYAIGFGP